VPRVGAHYRALAPPPPPPFLLLVVRFRLQCRHKQCSHNICASPLASPLAFHLASPPQASNIYLVSSPSCRRRPPHATHTRHTCHPCRAHISTHTTHTQHTHTHTYTHIHTHIHIAHSLTCSKRGSTRDEVRNKHIINHYLGTCSAISLHICNIAATCLQYLCNTQAQVVSVFMRSVHVRRLPH
jgi:hypothetical protein